MADPVFVYGTLTDPERAGAMLEEFEFRSAATLLGLHRVDGRYPTLAPGGTVDGRLLWTADLDPLDRYEGVAEGLYVRVSVPVAGGCGGDAAWVYVGDPGALGVAVDWPGTGGFLDRVRAYLAGHDVQVACSP